MTWEGALDSSGGAALALRGADGTTHVCHLPLALRTGERELASWLQRELATVGITIHDVRHWTVGTGPGSFSGLRVGIALLQGVCAGSGAALRGLPGSLAMVLAASRQYPTEREFVTVHDARQRQLIISHYIRTGATWTAAAAPYVATSEQRLARVPPGTRLVYLRDTLPPGVLPDGVGVIELAEFPVAEWLALPWDEMAMASAACEPVYVRPPVFTTPAAKVIM